MANVLSSKVNVFIAKKCKKMCPHNSKIIRAKKQQAMGGSPSHKKLARPPLYSPRYWESESSRKNIVAAAEEKMS